MGRIGTMMITGTRKGIGKYLVENYLSKGFQVIGCSRSPAEYELDDYQHFCLDVSDEVKVKQVFKEIRQTYGQLDVLINNAGIASMNHILLTPLTTVQNILNTNVIGVFLFCREAAKLMKKNHYGRIINFSTAATPLKLEGEAIYGCSKAAVVNLSQVLSKELAEFGITVNVVGPTPIKTDLIRSVPKEKIEELLKRQAIPRLTEFKDISNVIDFYIHPESDFVTGQTIYLGGV
jgi:3-oxoacyl-[acyl-carrier protein] reductase